MSDPAATSLPFPGRPRVPPATVRPRPRPDASRPDSVAVRLVVFATLAAFVAAHWITLLSNPPTGRVALAVLALIAGGAVLALIARAPIPLAPARVLAAVAALVATAAAAVAIGLPARFLAPAGWGGFWNGFTLGLSGLANVDYPYTGVDEWSRLSILLGLPASLGLAATLAFWPARRAAPALRTIALVVLVMPYAVAATVDPVGAPLVRGLVLLLGVAAWIWLPSLGRREALTGTALVLAAGVLSLPLTATLDGAHPWLDYRNWDWNWASVSSAESFSWDHTYGPLDWPRTGKALLDVRSDAPHYWKTVDLDGFDGFRWHQSTEPGGLEVPGQPVASVPFPELSKELNPRWVDRINVTVRSLRSQFVIGAGAVLSIDGLNGVVPVNGALAVPTDQALVPGDSYSAHVYVPNPTPARMRRAPERYPKILAQYTALSVPQTRQLTPATGRQKNETPSFATSPSSQEVPVTPVTVPFRGDAAGTRTAARVLTASPYRGVYRLARSLTAGAPTTYDAVRSVESYLRSSPYTYSETPPRREYPLRAFLFRDQSGYCQQFSGTMALMLRMAGIPARVASGFSAGTPAQAGNYVVRDLDAHSWVEVYFNGIGWVTFDPTPSAAPAASRSSRPKILPTAPTGSTSSAEQGSTAVRPQPTTPAIKGSSGGGVPWLLVAGLAAVLLAAVAAFAFRVLRIRSLSPARVAEAQLRELESALRRLRGWRPGGATLLATERWLSDVAGPAAAAYARRLGAGRYRPKDPGPPTPAERRALRRELSSGLGLRARLRGLIAIPPGGPAVRRRWRRRMP